ncbi:hypothetical protein IJ732_07975 [bacterium]|nr:hypothetical protein [bacterium]
MTEQEKEIKSKRVEIQKKILKFATRVPVFMYLTDYRERCLKDVIDSSLEYTGINAHTGEYIDLWDTVEKK